MGVKGYDPRLKSIGISIIKEISFQMRTDGGLGISVSSYVSRDKTVVELTSGATFWLSKVLLEAKRNLWNYQLALLEGDYRN